MRTYVLVISFLLLCAATVAQAAVVNVGGFGDQGWYSDDTRNNSGQNLVGSNYTHYGKPGQPPTAADDAQIANQIQFVGDAPGNTKALKLSWTAGAGSGKATLSTINTVGGFASGNWSNGFFANFRLYRETVTNTTLKIGVQSTSWGTEEGKSQYNFTAIRSGESAWDLTLVYAGGGTTGAWENIGLTSTAGTWCLFDQANNLFYTPPGNSANKTLADWALDTTWGDKLFGAGAKVASVQIGAGSFSVSSTGYVDYLETSLLNGGDRVNFVPEPGTLALLAAGLIGMAVYAWRRRK